MKALTLTQPWASLVAHEIKRIETRDWGTPYRGPIAIHAAKHFARRSFDTWKSGRPGLLELCSREPYRAALEGAGLAPASLPMGALVGVGRLVDVVRHDDVGTLPAEVVSRFMVNRLEEGLGGYGPGRVYWLLQGFHPIEPIPYRGALSLFDIPEKLLATHAGDRLR